MTDEEMDAFVAKGIDLTVPEGGPVYTVTEQELSDNELLQSPFEVETRRAQAARDKQMIRNFNPRPQLQFEPVPSIGETIIEDMATHPLSTAGAIGEFLLPAVNPMGWIPATADAIAEARNYVKGTTLDKYLPEMDSPYKFLRHMDENPGDWLHLIGVNSKLQDMIVNPEDYAE
ncbi:MAG: hypothetical protein KIG84_05840 [Bacteroidales bacterium]|nr:hypothetical protein [Bacteroidales bacterium]